MARSELGKRIERLSAEHGSGGAAPEFTRRDFLGYGTAAAGALVVAVRSRPQVAR
jgi:Ubiquitinol-cytochrome C reductase Fe-S subunit TAT signal